MARNGATFWKQKVWEISTRLNPNWTMNISRLFNGWSLQHCHLTLGKQMQNYFVKIRSFFKKYLKTLWWDRADFSSLSFFLRDFFFWPGCRKTEEGSPKSLEFLCLCLFQVLMLWFNSKYCHYRSALKIFILWMLSLAGQEGVKS